MSARLLGSACLVALVACSGGDGGSIDAQPVDAPVDAFAIPALRNPLSTPDAELAPAAAALLTERCQGCHAVTRDRVRAWEATSTAVVTRCLSTTMPMTSAEGAAIVDCLRAQPGVTTSGWPPDRLGIYAVAARLDWFRYVFNLGFGTTEGPVQLGHFVEEAAMPRGASTLTQGEFDQLAEWFARGLPLLDTVVPDDPPPNDCTTNVTTEVASHVAAMRTSGWRALNQEAGLLMFGCSGATTARQCLSTYPDSEADTFSAGWAAPLAGQVIRVLRINNYRSNYWTRSSADGRFVSHGGAAAASQTYRSTVIDLMTDREIPAAAQYDPGFFPDNSGFALQSGSARICDQSLLTAGPTQITFNEPECLRTTAVGLYQHMGAARNGDYWTVDGQFTNDNGGRSVTSSDPSSAFSSNAAIDLTPLVHTGTQFTPKDSIRKPLPLEGDVIISPSAKLIVSRVAAAGGKSLFLMRKVVATPNGTSYDIQLPEIARYCVRGGKPALSFDERWMVWHHYVEAADWQDLGYASQSDPAFVALRTQGAANIFVTEIATGVTRRLTTMKPGQYALYPHFRSDGWIYFIVRDLAAGGREYVAASDAALMLEQ